MKKNLAYYLFAFFLIGCFNISGQTRAMDSLNALLKTPLHDTTKLNVYKSLCDLCPTSDNLKYGNLGLSFVETLTNKNGNSKELLKDKAYFLKIIGIYYTDKKDYSKSMEIIDQRILLYDGLQDTISAEETRIDKARLYVILGNVTTGFDLMITRLRHFQLENNIRFIGMYQLDLAKLYGDYINNPKKSLEYYNKALKTFEIRKKEKWMADIFNYMSYQYSTIQKYDSALFCSISGLKLLQKTKAPKEVFFWNYFRISDIYSSLNKFDSALVYNDKCLVLAQQMKDSSFIGNAYAFISQTYLRSKDFKKAEKYELLSFDILKRHSDEEGIMFGYSRLGKMYKSNGKYEIALKYAEKSMELANKLNDLESKKFAHLLKYECFSAIGDFKNALNNYLQFTANKDTLEKRKNSAALEQAEIRTEFEKQETIRISEQQKQDVLAKEENDKQILLRNFFIIGFALVLLIAALIFRSYRIKQRSNIELIEKNELIASQKHLVEEKQKEILDSIKYARRIQSSLLPKDKYIYKTIKRLKNE